MPQTGLVCRPTCAKVKLLDFGQKKSRLEAAQEVNREASNRVDKATRNPEDWITIKLGQTS
jgi:hypothetical protein